MEENILSMLCTGERTRHAFSDQNSSGPFLKFMNRIFKKKSVRATHFGFNLVCAKLFFSMLNE
jgi:hypothetical protein